MTTMQTPDFPLPEAFLKHTQQMLGADFSAFLGSYDQPYQRGLRFRDERIPLAADDLQGRILYAKNAYYLAINSIAGATPLHEAGAFYIQEPSAMTAAAVLNPQDGERVLDLCAAPGGKSTQLAMSADLALLVANEPIPNRAQILSRNIERMGIRNAIVTSAYPDQLAKKWPGYFDKILVDAPCSGEGMFRKHPETRAEWNDQSPIHCAERQLDILSSAAKMLRAGGRLVYSTCTFNRYENEGVLESFLAAHSDFHLCAFSLPGLPEAPDGYLHLWPHQIRGEGHFVVLLEKDGSDTHSAMKPSLPPVDKKTADQIADFFTSIGCEALRPNALFAGRPVIMPDDYPDLSSIRTLRAGLHLGEFKGKTFAPDHAIALSISFPNTIELSDLEVLTYLHGDVLPCDESTKGFVILSHKGYQIGFGKASNGMIKNHYPKGLRK